MLALRSGVAGSDAELHVRARVVAAVRLAGARCRCRTLRDDRRTASPPPCPSLPLSSTPSLNMISFTVVKPLFGLV